MELTNFLKLMPPDLMEKVGIKYLLECLKTDDKEYF
jgi:hypothetical protein